MRKLLFVSLCMSIFCWASKPMESIDKYNVVLVHGADNSAGGFSCDGAAENARDAYTMYNDFLSDLDLSWKLGDSPGMLGGYDNENGLTHWLNTKIFEYKKAPVNEKDPFNFSHIYLQRSFSNPANSPAYNAHELGDRAWKGEKKCNERRSLIEEAQEVRAKGRTNLENLRKNVDNRDSLPPSRNILIAHSMGGVASREYVQNDSIYKEDVDKVITLDSPHEGTQALSLLVSLHEYWGSNFISAAAQSIVWSLALIAMSNDFTSDFLTLMTYIVGLNGPQGVITDVVDYFKLQEDFPYDSRDPLTSYIDPGNWKFNGRGAKTVEDLRTKKFDLDKQIPMFRLLYATKALTFTDPGHSVGQSLISIVVPDALSVAVRNFYSQFTSDNPLDLRVSSAFASLYMGALAGIGFEENGSSLIPEWSGKAENTPFLNDANVDVKKVPYNAAFHSKDVSAIASLLISSASTMAIATAALTWTAPQLIVPTKIVVTLGTGAMASTLIAADVLPFVNDFDPSHRAPTKSKYQSEWKADTNAYTKITGERKAYEPYLMEEFLYEKPFVNLRVRSSYDSDWKDTFSDTLGLYIKDTPKDNTNTEDNTDTKDTEEDTIKSTPLYLADNLSQSTPLKFKSSSDWETMGAKKEKWKITTGVGNEKIPIRHADRYPLPPIMVKNYIEKYEFEVDDLMPHRLRQIRINFNFNEDLAWECDVNKPEGDNTACVVYKRTPASNQWIPLWTEKHPVEKNGLFVFEPSKYDYNQLGIIQKDNQNTVTITTVNKIGLKNSLELVLFVRYANV